MTSALLRTVAAWCRVPPLASSSQITSMAGMSASERAQFVRATEGMSDETKKAYMENTQVVDQTVDELPAGEWCDKSRLS